jgi:hypothetical protein
MITAQILAIVLLAAPPAGESDAAAAPAFCVVKHLGADDRRAEESLARRLATIEFRRMPLGDALRAVFDMAGAPHRIDWRALNAVGVFSDTEVTLDANELPAADVVAALLEQAAGRAGVARFAAHDGMIVVSSSSSLARRPETRTYRCPSLFSARLSPAERTELQRAVADLWKQHYHVFSPPWQRAPRRWGSEGRRRKELNDLAPRQRETQAILDDMLDLLARRRARQLVELIKSSVDPESWRDESHASIQVLDDILVITQTAAVHADIERLLRDLAESCGAEGLAASAPSHAAD